MFENYFWHVSDDFKKKNLVIRKKKFDEKMLRFFAEMPLGVNLFPLESSIQKYLRPGT